MGLVGLLLPLCGSAAMGSWRPCSQAEFCAATTPVAIGVHRGIVPNDGTEGAWLLPHSSAAGAATAHLSDMATAVKDEPALLEISGSSGLLA